MTQVKLNVCLKLERVHLKMIFTTSKQKVITKYSIFKIVHQGFSNFLASRLLLQNNIQWTRLSFKYSGISLKGDP